VASVPLPLAAHQVLDETRQILERIEHQLAFAEDLLALFPRRAAAWRPLLARARTITADPADPASLARACAQMETLLAPLSPYAKQCVVHCVGHAHIDMNWLWSWPETVAVTVDTFTSVLGLMAEFPEFCFTQSQASVYEIVERYRPDLLAAIARRVSEGRWEVAASHWVENDQNMAGPESLARHVLSTRRYMKGLFGLEPESIPLLWSPDTFGHAATVPSYLAQAAIRYVYLHRPGTHTSPKPWLFWWEGPDGSRVLVRNDSHTTAAYNGTIRPALRTEFAAFARETGLRHFLFVYGVGDHGGGPTRRDLEMTRALNAWPLFPTLRFSTARAFFETVEPLARSLPVLRGELNFEMAGCYTSQAVIKKANRYGENRLADAETAAALASAAGLTDYPRARFEEAWRPILFNQFHDILPGSCVASSRAYALGLYQQSIACSTQIESSALKALAASVATASLTGKKGSRPAIPPSPAGAGSGFICEEGGLSHAAAADEGRWHPYVFFNPCAFDRREIVEVQVWEGAHSSCRKPFRERSFVVHTPDGHTVPIQVIERRSYWGHEFAAVSFPLDVPAFGYAAVVIEEQDEPPAPNSPSGNTRVTMPVHHCRYVEYERAPVGLENEFLSVVLDPTTGGLARVADRSGKLLWINVPSASPNLELEFERPGGMSAWLIRHRGAPPEYPRLKKLSAGLSGPYRASLVATYALRESQMTVTTELRSGDPRLHIRLEVEWFQRGTPETGVPALSFALPFALKAVTPIYEIPFGFLRRELRNREEVPALQWAQLNGQAGRRPAGCLVLNDGKYGHSLEGSVFRLSLLRGSYEPDPWPDIGRHEIQLALLPFAGTLTPAEAIREGQRFNRPLRFTGTGLNKGRFDPIGRFLRVETDGVIVTGLKKAEESDRLVLHLFNASDRPATVRFRVEPNAPLGRPREAVLTDLLERPISSPAVHREKGTIRVALPPRRVAALAMAFDAS